MIFLKELFMIYFYEPFMIFSLLYIFFFISFFVDPLKEASNLRKLWQIIIFSGAELNGNVG